MRLIDTHVHLYAEDFKYDITQIIERAEIEGVEKFFLPAIDSSTHAEMILLETRFPKKCFAMIGLHPCSVKQNYLVELEIVENYLKEKKFIAIGEIGLDFYWDKTFALQQVDAFNKQIEIAIKYNLPIVIHTRKAMADTIRILKEYSGKNIKGIFHCFGGTYDDALEIIDMGFYLGIGGVVTYKNAGLAEIVDKIDLKYLVLETDSPYLPPVPFRGKRNESSYLKYIAEKITEIKLISLDEVANITSLNAEKIFGI